jgi:hypothetical protein
VTARRVRCRHRRWRTGTCGSRCALRGQHQESVGLDAPAVGHDPGDRLLVGGPVFGAWRPGAGGVHDAFLTTYRRTWPGSGVGTASSRVGVLPPEAVAGGGRAARWARRRSLNRGGRGRARVGGCRARAGRRRVASVHALVGNVVLGHSPDADRTPADSCAGVVGEQHRTALPLAVSSRVVRLRS